MGTSLAFHLTSPIFGVGLPVMMLAAEGLHLRTGDPDLARARAAMVEGVRGPVRRRRRLRHDHLVRARPAVAAASPVSRAASSACRSRSRASPSSSRRSSSASTSTAGTGCRPARTARRRAGRDPGHRVGVLHRHGERLDERAARLPPRARRDHAHRPAARDVQPGVADRDHAHGRRRAARDAFGIARSTRSACCAGAATATTASGLALGMTAPRSSPRSSSASATSSAGPWPRTSRPSSPRSRASTRPRAAPGSTSAASRVPGQDTQRPEHRDPARSERPGLRRRRRPGARPGLVPEGRPDAAHAARPPLVPRHGRDRHVPHRALALVLAAPPRRPRPEDWRTLLALGAAGPLAFVANELGGW